MKIRHFAIFLITLICSQEYCYSKDRSDKLKPKWLTNALPEAKTDSYIFVSSHGEGGSISGARQMAFVAMSQKLEIERGLTVNTNLEIRENLTQTSSSTSSDYNQEIVLDVTEKGHKLQIVCREIDEYWEEKDGKYNIDVLYTVTNKNLYGGSYDDQIKVTSEYSTAGFLSLVPGVGQYYKGSKVKGSIILGTEILTAGGVLLCENTRASYVKKMKEQPKHASEYNSRANSWETGRNMCIGAAAAIYAYNLIDAFVAQGAKRVVVKKGNMSLSAMPYVANDVYGVGLAVNF